MMFAGGALAAAIATPLGAPLSVQIVVFARRVGPAARGHPPLAAAAPARARAARRDGAASARSVGRTVVVQDGQHRIGGRVKLIGEVWTARGSTPARVRLAVGTEVRVVQIDGATAVVDAAACPLGASAGAPRSSAPSGTAAPAHQPGRTGPTAPRGPS